MLKQSTVTAFVFMICLQTSSLAKPAESSRPEREGYSERLPFTQINDSPIDGKKPCEGLSVKEFLQGTCDKLKGFDRLHDVRNQSGDHKSGFRPFYEFSPIHRLDSFQKDAGGHAWHIHGEEGTFGASPFFTEKRSQRSLDREREFNKKSVEDFMNGKSNKLRGIDTLPSNLEGPVAPAWGGDEFVKMEGFTQSGPPYQHVNPPYGIDPPKFENFKPGFKIDPPKLEDWHKLQK